jgi:TPR repeat protein
MRESRLCEKVSLHYNFPVKGCSLTISPPGEIVICARPAGCGSSPIPRDFRVLGLRPTSDLMIICSLRRIVARQSGCNLAGGLAQPGKVPWCARGSGIEAELAFDGVNAAKYYKLAADQHDAQAQFNYAVCLTHGEGVHLDLINAAKYYKLAADQHIPQAQFNYAVCLTHGNGVNIDLVNAAKYYKLAADQNYAPAQFNYAVCLEHGDGVHLDLINAAKYYKLAADQHEAKAQFNYAVCLEHGDGVNIDLVNAAKYYKLAADHNRAMAQSAYGICLECGYGGAPNAKRVIAQYKRAAAFGNEHARRRLGECLEFGESISKDLERAADCYRLSAANGDIASQVRFGFCTEHGIGVEASVSESRAYYQAAAQHKNPDGAFHSALLNQYGAGGDVDLDEAGSYYEVTNNRQLAPDHSFRCLRILKKAPVYRGRNLRHSSVGRTGRPVFGCVRSLPVSQDPGSYRTSAVGSEAGRTIATGTFSRVTMRQNRIPGECFAIKHLSAELPRHVFIREVEHLVKLNHPCVVRILHWAPSENRKEAEIHMQYAANGSLAGLLGKVNSPPKPTFWSPTGMGILICGLVLGMRYVHWRQILHLDWKPSNILVTSDGHPLIGDFGSSRLVSDTDRSSETATVYYAAPEMYQEDAKRTTKCDVFSFGLVLYEMLVGQPVFPSSEHPFPVMRRLLAGDLPDIPTVHGPVMAKVIRDCWERDPKDRPSFGEIFERFESCHFEILPEADPVQISNFCTTVLTWESEAGIRI